MGRVSQMLCREILEKKKLKTKFLYFYMSLVELKNFLGYHIVSVNKKMVS